MPTGSDEAGARQRAIRLLEDTHEFPADYPLTVIVTSDDDVVAAVRAAVELGLAAGAATCEVVASSGSKYLSLRFTVRCPDAESVLDLHERVRVVPGVLRVL